MEFKSAIQSRNKQKFVNRLTTYPLNTLAVVLHLYVLLTLEFVANLSNNMRIDDS